MSNFTMFDDIYPVFEDYQYKPYFYYMDIFSKKELNFNVNLYFSNYIHNLFSKNKLIVKNDSDIKGVAFWAPLDWDSKQIGMNVATINIVHGRTQDILKELVDCVLSSCRQLNFNYVTIRTQSDNYPLIHSSEESGFILLDTLLTFSYDMRQLTNSPSEENIRPAQASDIPFLKNIARSAFRHDRFHADPLIKKDRADELHGVWVENSCKGVAADVVLVSEYNGELAGFITCKIDVNSREFLNKSIGSIVLIATSQNYKRQGIASSLLKGAMQWFKSKAVDFVEVGTQTNNIAAARLYLSNGFKLVNSTITLRKHI